nr:unnamed protein product [Callosobruchus analis]
MSVENYRGISRLSCFSKIIESAEPRRLVSFIEKSNLITPCQHGFRKARSTGSITTSMQSCCNVQIGAELVA